MALKFMLDTLDGLDEAIAGLYEADGDGFRLSVDGAESAEDVAGLKKSQKRLIREKKDQETRLAALEGIDPEKYREMIEAQEKAENDRLEKKGEFDKLRDQMAANHKDELAKHGKRENGLIGQIEKLLIDADAIKIITSDEFRGSPALLLHEVRRRTRVVEQADGSFAKEVLLADGSTLDVDGDGKSRTITDLVSQLRDDPAYGRAFPSSGAKGTGSRGSDAPPAGRKGETVVERGDNKAFLKNLDGIAGGIVAVE